MESYTIVQLPEEVKEHDDPEIAREIQNRKLEIEINQVENKKLRERLEEM